MRSHAELLEQKNNENEQSGNQQLQVPKWLHVAGRIAARLAAAMTLQPGELARHSSLTDLTQRSAYEFKFGLLAGKRIGFTLPDSISSRKDSQNFVSRSCSR